jgi:aspartate oxidase
MSNVTPEQAKRIDMDPYTREAFVEDVLRLDPERRSNPALIAALVDNSRDALDWLAKKVRVPFILPFHRQAYEVNGRYKFWGGLYTSVDDGGKGLIAAHQKALRAAGVEIWFNCPLLNLVLRDNRIAGLIVRKDNCEMQIDTPAVVLAAGGFEANPEMRAIHLGPGWEKAKARVLTVSQSLYMYN